VLTEEEIEARRAELKECTRRNQARKLEMTLANVAEAQDSLCFDEAAPTENIIGTLLVADNAAGPSDP